MEINTITITAFDSYGNESAHSAPIYAIYSPDSLVLPVADAGMDLNVFDGETVYLDATMSYDEDNGIASYFWEQTSGTSVTLSDPYSPLPFFTAPESGVDGEALVFELTVTDYEGLSAKDSVIINISMSNNPPIADAGFDQFVVEGDIVSLDASASYDSDDGIGSILWTQVSGIPASLPSTTELLTSFTAPLIDTESSDLVFVITVTDYGGLQSSDSVTVNVADDISDPVTDPAEVLIGTYDQHITSKGRRIKFYIELPGGYGVDLINVYTIGLSQINGIDLDQPISISGSVEFGDENYNGIPDMTLRFDRREIESYLDRGDNQIKVTGSLLNGAIFEQSALLRYK